MDAHTKTIISHALVLYDYLYDGCLPNLKVFQYKPINRSDFPILNQNGYDVPGENDKFPFKMPAETATDGACRFELLERQQLATPLLGQSMWFGRTTWVSKPQSSETSTNHRWSMNGFRGRIMLAPIFMKLQKTHLDLIFSTSCASARNITLNLPNSSNTTSLRRCWTVNVCPRKVFTRKEMDTNYTKNGDLPQWLQRSGL